MAPHREIEGLGSLSVDRSEGPRQGDRLSLRLRGAGIGRSLGFELIEEPFWVAQVTFDVGPDQSLDEIGADRAARTSSG
jgi:hypothetical protein